MPKIKHECGIAFLRLRKPLQYYIDKYKTPSYPVGKMFLMMHKQRNRGQDGAGVASLKLNTQPGKRYISRYRSVKKDSIQDIFNKINKKFEKALLNPDYNLDENWVKNNIPFTGEVWLGHLRYGTFGGNSIENCAPTLRQNNWKSKNLIFAGNFNMTNLDDLFQVLVELGQSPKEKSDTVTILEKVGHFLDEENNNIYSKYSDQIDNKNISTKRIFLIFGTRTSNDLLCVNEINTLVNNLKNLKYIPVLSRENWSGKKGYVHDQYLDIINKTDLNNPIFYLCGWRDMIKEARTNLKELGYDSKSRKVEIYG